MPHTGLTSRAGLDFLKSFNDCSLKHRKNVIGIKGKREGKKVLTGKAKTEGEMVLVEAG